MFGNKAAPMHLFFINFAKLWCPKVEEGKGISIIPATKLYTEIILPKKDVFYDILDPHRTENTELSFFMLISRFFVFHLF